MATMPKIKTLIPFNGRADAQWLRKLRPDHLGRIEGHAYVAAYSRADCRRVIKEFCGRDPGEAEIRGYWNQGCWGKPMAGIELSRGIWLTVDNKPGTGPDAKPVKVYPL